MDNSRVAYLTRRGMTRRLPICYPVLLGMVLLLTSCAAPQVRQGQVSIKVSADGETKNMEMPAGSSAEDALTAAGILLGPLDRTNPPLYTILSEGSDVRVVRVREEFNVEQVVIPYEQQRLKNESLPEGEEYSLQSGENGLLEITTRRLYEDGVEVSNNVVKSVIINESRPQITMVGVQKPFAPISIPGRLAYLLDGSAWIMETSTANRRQVVGENDLDGRVFSLSPDGDWLLFTRRSEQEGVINHLWAAKIDDEAGQPVDLGVENVVHFADWKPGSTLTVAYSTVEPRTGAPGWQANNNLELLSFSSTGFVRSLPPILETNSGGLYGWWGTNFSWAPDGSMLAFARPDGFGTIDLESGVQNGLVEITPLQTFGDWAWVPGVAWGSDGKALYSEVHQPPAESQAFDLLAFPLTGSEQVTMVSQVGMFAQPVASPLVERPSGELAYQMAYLQAIFPSQSETSRYRLVVMDRDGSNKQVIFPSQGAGLEPQTVVWSPEPLQGSEGFGLAFLYENNLWIVDTKSGEAWQITGDGLAGRIDWR